MFRRVSRGPGLALGRIFASSQATRSYAHKKSDQEDFYDLLGISRSASQDEIKKAYRKKAIEKHPDQGGSSEEFTKINEAYSVLSDASKRSMYDQYGREGLSESGGPGPGFDPNDIFSQFFGGRSAGPEASPMTEDKAMSISVTLEDLYKGREKTVLIRRPAVCTKCMGAGSTKPGAKKKCGKCHGTGQETVVNHVGPGMVQQFITTCRTCHGQGQSLRREDACGSCKGEGFENVNADVPVPLDASVFHMDVIVLRSQAGCIPGASPGDLHVQVEVRKHPVFQRQGYDLLVKQKISLVHALTGGEFVISHLDGRKLVVKTTPHSVLSTGSVLLLRNEGMPRKNGTRGNLYVIVTVSMPTTLSAENRKELQKVLGTPSHVKLETTHSSEVIVPDVVPSSAEDFVQNKQHEWSKAEASNEEISPGVEKVSSSTYGNRTTYTNKKKRHGSSSNQAQCQTA